METNDTARRLNEGFAILAEGEGRYIDEGDPIDETDLGRPSCPILYHDDKPRTWLKREPVRSRTERIVPELRLATEPKFCVDCGKKAEPNGVILRVWYHRRRCEDCKSKPRVSVAERGGKYCMQCGKFHTFRTILRMVHSIMGVGTWATCAKCKKK